MDYFNDMDTTGFYPTNIAGEFYAYPIQTSVPGWAEVEVPVTSPFDWSVGGQQDYTSGPQISLRAEATSSQHHYSPPENREPIQDFPESTQDRNRLSFPERHPTTTDQYSEPSHSGVGGRDNNFVNMMASGTSVVAPAPDNLPFGCWRTDQSEPPTSELHTNVQTPYQPGIGSTRTETRYRRILPCPADRSWSPTNPSGGLSEATADAETEEDARRRQAAKRTRDTEKVREGRSQCRARVLELRTWAMKWERRVFIPSHAEALSIALEVVGTIRKQVYLTPQLSIGSRTAEGEEGPDSDHLRRVSIRRLNERLSMYYGLPNGQPGWLFPELLSNVLQDIVHVPRPPAAPPGPAPIPAGGSQER